MAQPPQLLTLRRHRELDGLYTTGLVARRIGYLILGLLAILGLLGVFGQRPATDTADASAARLELYAPSHVRGGLLFMARFRITAHEDMKKATLVLDPGWAESMTINTIEPAPTDETSDNGRLALTLGPIKAGDSFLLFMQFQVNPTNVGRRNQTATLFDGGTEILHIDRTITVFP